jgi:hypothetical protein
MKQQAAHANRWSGIARQSRPRSKGNRRPSQKTTGPSTTQGSQFVAENVSASCHEEKPAT